MAYNFNHTIHSCLVNVFSTTKRPLSAESLALMIDAPKADVEKALAAMVENNKINGPTFQGTAFYTAKS